MTVFQLVCRLPGSAFLFTKVIFLTGQGLLNSISLSLQVEIDKHGESVMTCRKSIKGIIWLLKEVMFNGEIKQSTLPRVGLGGRQVKARIDIFRPGRSLRRGEPRAWFSHVMVEVGFQKNFGAAPSLL